ncbi:MAG: hypothetical protein JXL67_13910 [Calditrichaeota bacterium]|nr:hypothetical protein [Calditrichota bacterium]
MKFYHIWLVLLFFLIIPVIHAGDTSPALNENLKELAPFVGKTWRGVFSGSSADKPMIDISRWERALNGNAVRILHSLNEGEYGGETIIIWDREKQKLIYFYFTTEGFYTRGTMEISNNQFTSHEYVTGNKNGITEVKAEGTIKEDGTLYSKSSYLQNGEWVDGHEVIYTEAPEAEVNFR